MSEHDLASPTVAPEMLENGAAALAGPESLKEGLRRQRKESIEMVSLELALPEYSNPQLVGKYHIVDPDEMAKIGNKIKSEFKTMQDRVRYGSIDSIIEACDGLYARMPGEKELIPLDSEIPMKYDIRLAEYLGFEVTTAREVVLETFGQNIYAIIDHNMKITRWMADRKADLGDGLGEM